MRRFALSVATLSTLIACGGGSAQKGAETPSVAVGKSSSSSGTTVDSGPVRFPEGLVAWAHVARPGALVKSGAAWVHMSEKDAANAISSAGKEVGSDLVALDQPIDGAMIATAVSFDGLKGAVSFSVTNIGAAKDILAKKFDLETLSDGTVHAKSKKVAHSDADTDGDSDDKRPIGCMVHADGHTVCGDEAVLGTLDAFLLRDVPRLGSKSDMHVEFRVQPVRDIAGPFLAALTDHTDAPASGDSSDAASKDAERKSKEEAKAFLEDVDTIQFDGTLDENRFRSEFSIDLRSKKSLFAQWMAEPGTAPALSTAFGAVAANADLSLWAGGGRTLLAQTGRTIFEKAMEDEFKGRPAAERAKAEALAGKLYDALFTFHTLAVGYDDAAIGKIADAATGPKASAAAKKRLLVAANGDEQLWVTASFATPFAALKELLTAVDKLPENKSKPKKKDAKKTYPSKVTALPKGSSFPAESFYLVGKEDVKDKHPLTVAPKFDKNGKPVKETAKTSDIVGTVETHMIVVPLGGESWLFVGDTYATLDALYKQALAGKTPPALNGLISGGQFSAKLMAADKFDEQARAPEVVTALLAERAKLANAPVIDGGTLVTNQGGHTRMTFRTDTPRAAFEAIKAFNDKGIGKTP